MDRIESRRVSRSAPAPYVRKEFVLTKTLHRALAYITARGMFIASINGNRVGKELLSPEWSDYKKRIQYFTYDVTNQIKNGANCIGMIIGDGWYKGYVGFALKPNNYGDQTSGLLQLHLEYADGTQEIVGTDATWKGSYGPILYSDMLMGESYDARREMRGWDKPGFDDAQWLSVDVFPAPDVLLVPLRTEPVRITQLLKPKNVTESVKGTFVFDLGQNFAGFCRLKVRGQAGTKVTVRHAEVLNPDGTIYTTNLRRAKATETYVLKGGREEILQPHFTFHGFRYVEVTGLSEKPRRDAILWVRHQHRSTDHRHLHVFRCDGESAVQQHPLEPARQFHQHPDRLSATRRATRLDGRCADLCPDSIVQHGRSFIHDQMDV